MPTKVLQRFFSKKGISKELLVRTEGLAATEGAERIWLNACNENASALRFYEAQGNGDVGVFIFEGDRYEARVFVKELSRNGGREDHGVG